MINDKIAEKIRKCFALAESDNPHEAGAALRQAQKLMALYNITEASLTASEVVQESAKSSAGRNPPEWEYLLAETIDGAFGLKHFVRQGYCHPVTATTIRPAEFVYLGRKMDVEVAAYTHAVIARQILKGRVALLTERFAGRSRGDKIRVGDSYCKGFVIAVRAKIAAMVVSPFLESAIEAKLLDICGDRTLTVTRRKGSFDGMAEGLEAGAKASLYKAAEAAKPTLKLS